MKAMVKDVSEQWTDLVSVIDGSCNEAISSLKGTLDSACNYLGMQRPHSLYSISNITCRNNTQRLFRLNPAPSPGPDIPPSTLGWGRMGDYRRIPETTLVSRTPALNVYIMNIHTNLTIPQQTPHRRPLQPTDLLLRPGYGDQLSPGHRNNRHGIHRPQTSHHQQRARL